MSDPLALAELHLAADRDRETRLEAARRYLEAASSDPDGLAAATVIADLLAIVGVPA